MMKKRFIVGASVVALMVSAQLLLPKKEQLAYYAMPLTMGMLATKTESTVKIVTHLGNLVWSSGSTISGTIDIGAAHSKKEIFLASINRGAAARSLTAASTTIDGVAVTKATTEHTFGPNYCSCAFAALPTQSGSVNVTVTYSGTLTAGAVGVYSVLNRTNIGSNQTDSDTDSNGGAATSSTLSLTTININGIWFATHLHVRTGAPTTSPGIEDYDAEPLAGFWLTVCHRDFQGSSSTPSDVFSWAGGANCLSASWSFD